MNRYVISGAEMERRLAMAKAKEMLTTAMAHHSLTAQEWLQVLQEIQTRMIAISLREDWDENGITDA